MKRTLVYKHSSALGIPSFFDGAPAHLIANQVALVDAITRAGAHPRAAKGDVPIVHGISISDSPPSIDVPGIGEIPVPLANEDERVAFRSAIMSAQAVVIQAPSQSRSSWNAVFYDDIVDAARACRLVD